MLVPTTAATVTAAYSPTDLFDVLTAASTPTRYAANLPPSEWDLFRKLLPPQLLNDLDTRAEQTAYTPWVVTWLLVFQRLHGTATLNDAVSEFILRFPPHALPNCKRAQEHTLSANTGAYGWRGRLHSRVLYWAASNVFDSLVETYLPSWDDRRVFILDGTTVQLAPVRPLRAAFPPARDQHGESPWPIVLLLTAHELASGLATFPEYGPMYGANATSELALAVRMVANLPERSILLADRNFGVFAFAWAATQAKHDVVVRLTKKRFHSMQKKAKWVEEGKWELTWRPSPADRKGHPHLAADAAVKGWLYEVQVSPTRTLWLFVTMEGTPQQWSQLYHQRQDVETDIRDLKETLELGEMTSKSVGMVEKELLAALVAYNLANQVRRLAAARIDVEPRRLSFSGVWSLLKAFVASLLQGLSSAEAEEKFERLLRAAGQRKLPKRTEDRSFKREVLPRGNKFPTRKGAGKQQPP